VVSIIDFKRKDDDRTWLVTKPRNAKGFPADHLLQMNVRDSIEVKLIDYFPSEPQQRYHYRRKQLTNSSGLQMDQ